jgi:hypothetical protein
MSASGFTPIQLYRSTTAAAVPTAGNLVAGELAINLTDEKLYFENASGVVKVLADSTYVGTVTSVAASGGTTGMTFSGGPITGAGTLTLSGTLAVANGGTGQTTYTNGQLLIGNTTGNTLTKATLTAGSGVSISNGTGSITISATGSGGTVTSVDASGGTTGMTFSGGPVTGTGTLTLAGTLAVANGGTGTATAFTAGSVVFAGASGVYTQDNANLFWDNANDRLGIGTATPTQLLHVRQDQNGTTAALIQNRNGSGTPVSAVQFISGAFDLSDNRYAMISSAGGSNTTLQFWTGSGATPTERMRITDTGNVGIGTTGPTSRLTVTGGDAEIRDGNYLTLRPSGNAWDMRLQATGTQLDVLSGGTLGSPIMSLLNGGNVGIGTSAPAAVLDVNGSQVTRGDASGFVYFAPKIGTSPFGANYDRFEIRVDPSTQVTLLGNVNGGTGAARALGFLAGTNERMRIDTAGNVGIGTSAPGKTLDLVGQFRASGSAASGYALLEYGTSATATNNWHVGSEGDGTFRWYNGNLGGGTERMRITSAGDVGIGTSGPGYRLDIASGDTTAGLGYAMRIRSNATATAATIQFTTSTVSTQNGIIACSDTGAMTIQTDGASSVLAFRTNGSERLRILNTGGITSGDLADAVGYKGVPQNAQTSAYTLALSDMGKHISITTGGVVIPANGSVAFPIGSTIVVYNDSGSAQNISITTDTLRLAGTATTGTRSLAQRGLATCVKVAATEWVVTGNVT